MEQSEADITTTLVEYDNARLEDYNNFTWKMFDREKLSYLISGYTKNISIDGKDYELKPDLDSIRTSNTLGVPVWFDEVEYQLNISPESGSLCHYTVDNGNQIIVADNTIKLLNAKTKSVQFKALPIFQLEVANIRSLKGSWEDNIKWSVQEFSDEEGNFVYDLRALHSGIVDNTSDIKDNGHIILVPGLGATLEYSTDTKWQAPMLILSGYKFDFSNVNTDYMDPEDLKTFYDIPSSTKFIIEVIQGEMMFNTVKLDNDSEVSAKVIFGQHFNTEYWEHEIKINYKYTSGRQMICYINGFEEFKKALDESLKGCVKNFEGDVTTDELDMFIIETNNLVKNIKGGNQHWTDQQVKSFLDDPEIRDYYANLLYRQKLSEFQNEIYKAVTRVYDEFTVLNKEHKNKVNHLGKYSVSAIGYDRYNALFNNRAEIKKEVLTEAPEFDIVLNQEYSDNSSEFTTRNCYGKLLDETEKNNIISNITGSTPKFSDYYMTYDMSQDKGSLSWWNYAYSEAVPRINDRLIFLNNKIQVKDFTVNGDKLVCNVFDYNKRMDHLYHSGSVYNLIAFDKLSYKHQVVAEGLTFESIEESGPYANYDAVLRLISDKAVDYDPELRYYLINTYEHPLVLDNIKNDYNTRTSTITFPDYYEKLFTKGDVIRVTYNVEDYQYRTLSADYSKDKNPLLHNALYDSLYPCVFVRYESGETKEFQISKLKDYNDVTVTDIENIEVAILACYSYDEDNEWTVYDLSEYFKNISTVLPKTLIVKLIENINNPDFILPEKIYKSHSVWFDKYKDIIYCNFRDVYNQVANRLYNSVSYRVTDVYEYQKYIRKEGTVKYYGYTLNGLLDTNLMERKSNKDIQTMTVTVGYPYKELVTYQALCSGNSVTEPISYGGNEYSLLQTSVDYDTSKIFLDNYIDSNFNCFVFDYNPDNAFLSWYDNNESIFNADKYRLYEYHNTPVTVNRDIPVIFKPCLNKQFKENSTYQWNVYGNTYSFLTDEYATDKDVEKLFCVINEYFSITADRPGPMNIELTVTDRYGNRMTGVSDGILLVK